MATVVVGDFEWDDLKARQNLRKHRVSFEEAISVLADPRAISAPDFIERDRWIVIGESVLLRVLFVVHTEQLRAGRIRIISARRASRGQRRKYYEET